MMITINSIKINTLTQISYDIFLQSIQIHQLPCTCGLSGFLTKHGYYTRSVKNPDGIIKLSVLRVKCSHCGKTHAIFPMMIVPYSQVLLKEHLSIINAYLSHTSFDPIMLANEFIDESNICYIIRQYLRHWKERIAAFNFTLSDTPELLSGKCINLFKRQFMQIKCTLNILST